MLRFNNSFGEDISYVIHGVAMPQFDDVIFHHIPNEVILHVEMLGSIMVDWVMFQLDDMIITKLNS